MKHHNQRDDSIIECEVGFVELADGQTIEALRLLFCEQQDKACAALQRSYFRPR